MPKRRRREGAWQRRNKKTNDHSEGSGGEPGVRGAGYTPIVKENDRFVKYYQAPPCRLPLFLLHLQCSSTLPSLYSSVTRFVSLFFSLSRTNFSSHMSALFVSHL
ncbi:hypothetical protein GBAR_LOCUS353 [Geodia barretti]|uniref:Uncharacterized protein n=1 Tax=Geodia barretti TaxID=519541 RepID=A0AA35QSG4_GEOBA|nr:hypothetical protein GBAR_LOCUS353 [Geodia barretti]